ncbi:MAG TPA: M3 family oligoendopeptidase [Alphaproteobacteria bacterium]|nr:M3 family oligoendopeptidase [Alphaproteobacteria bacterium]
MPDASTADTALENLPTWDLTDLYPGMEAPDLEQDFQTAEREAKSFAAKYEGKLSSLSAEGLAEAIARYEAQDERLSRVMSYAGLLHAGDQLDPTIGGFYQNAHERVTTISAHLLFFTLELNKLDDATLQAWLTAPAMEKYRPWLENVLKYKPHQLSDELEKFLHEQHIVGTAAWVRLFDETMAGLHFPLNGKELTSAEALHLLSDPSAETRKAAAHSLGQVFAKNLPLFARITNTLAKDKEIDDRWRKYPRPVSARNLANQVEDDVVDALVKAVRDSYPRLSHRYYAMKAKWMGGDKLDYWDRNAPLPDADDRTISFDEARDTVLSAYASFSPRLADVGRKFFDNAWIDVPTRPGKSPGAFAHPTVPSAHPYLLLNYQGKIRDVMTLAHELGHGCHQVLAGSQGHFLARTPLTLAETASVFGEMLTFRVVLDSESDPAKRRVLLAQKVEDMLNTVVRQIAFYCFEEKVHNARREGEISAEQLCDFWMEIQTESLGPALRYDEHYRSFWTYIGHFIHAPFYVYAYAFGDCLVNALYAQYQQQPAGFEEKYLNLLSAGGRMKHQDLLAPFGLDASDPAFWNKGLDVIAGMIDELEALGQER